MKLMNKKDLKSKITSYNGSSAYTCVLEELKVLQRLEHPNILYLHEIIDDPSKDNIFLITQYHSKGSLADVLERKNFKYILINK
jgi:serine/threonine protein kinase